MFYFLNNSDHFTMPNIIASYSNLEVILLLYLISISHKSVTIANKIHNQPHKHASIAR